MDVTLPGVFLSIQIDRKVFGIEVNDGRVLFNTHYTMVNKLMALQQWSALMIYMIIIFKLDSLGPSSVPSMLVAESSHWQQETLPSAALEVWTESKIRDVHKTIIATFWF